MRLVDEILLASQSKFKRELLERAKIPFDCFDPPTNESQIVGGTAKSVAISRARAKAYDSAKLNPLSLTIGSDQTLELDLSLIHI